jgi:hypothetical protein
MEALDVGTNYYLHRKPCVCCGRGDDPLHIGKSSAGWHFSLHVIPNQKINSLNDWITLWSDEGAVIKNEYNEVVTPEFMISNITERKGKADWNGKPFGWLSWGSFHASNFSEPGLNGLIAHRWNATRTDGTYDLIEGEFS